jgi:hypothetical protein
MCETCGTTTEKFKWVCGFCGKQICSDCAKPNYIFSHKECPKQQPALGSPHDSLEGVYRVPIRPGLQGVYTAPDRYCGPPPR